jgi:hypothetical protein
MLRGKKDLGVHTELLGDGIIDLIEAGVITNKKKTFNPGKCVATIYNGTQKLYDYVDRNPRFELRPVDYTNDVRIICQHDNLVSINACLQVDLLGQVNSETINENSFPGSAARWTLSGAHVPGRKVHPCLFFYHGGRKDLQNRLLPGEGVRGDHLPDGRGLRGHRVRIRQAQGQKLEGTGKGADRNRASPIPCSADGRIRKSIL